MRTIPQHRDATAQDLDVIEVIDADPAAFGSTRGAPPRVRSQRGRARWPWLAAALAIAVVAVLAAVLVATRPWETPSPWRTFPIELDESAQSGQYVFAAPVTPKFSVSHGVDRTTGELLTASRGHVFAAPGATFERGRWAMFRIEHDPSPELKFGSDPAAAVVETTMSGHSRLVGNPRPGQRFTVEARGLTDEEVRSFAAAVGEQGGDVALRSDDAPGDLQPVAGLTGFLAAQQLLNGLTQGSSPADATIVRYRGLSTPTSVSSVRAPADAIRAIMFLLGGAPTEVHGRTATVAGNSDLGSVVAWHEDGRLIVVTDAVAPEQLIVAAQAVQHAAENTDPFNGSDDGEGRALAGDAYINVLSGVDAEGRTWTAFVEFGAATEVCVVVEGDSPPHGCRTDLHATLPRLNHVTADVGELNEVVVVLSNAHDPGSVQLSGLDGNVTVLPLRPLVWNFSGAAFLAAPGQSYSIMEN